MLILPEVGSSGPARPARLTGPVSPTCPFEVANCDFKFPARHPKRLPPPLHFCTRLSRICTFARSLVSPRGSAALRLQLREAHVQERTAFGGEDAGVPIRRELHAIALGELGALDRVGAV